MSEYSFSYQSQKHISNALDLIMSSSDGQSIININIFILKEMCTINWIHRSFHLWIEVKSLVPSFYITCVIFTHSVAGEVRQPHQPLAESVAHQEPSDHNIQVEEVRAETHQICDNLQIENSFIIQKETKVFLKFIL